MARTVYRVVPDSGDWAVKRDGLLLQRFIVKSEAVSYGQKVARANPPSQLVVHRADGTIEYEYTYGDDPFPPSG